MRIAVLTGGSTPERSVALAGAGQVAPALRSLGHEVSVVDTCLGSLAGEREGEVLGAAVGSAPPGRAEVRRLEKQEDLLATVRLPELRLAEVIFLVLHGRQGEGGAVQALLELEGLLYTGSDHLGSAVAMDKDLSKRLLRAAGVPTAPWLLQTTRSVPTASEVRALGLPVVVKPSRVGSTVGLSLVHSEAEFDQALGRAMLWDSQVLLERYVPGRELTVGVLGDEALGVGEIIPQGEIFDFHDKYTPGRAEEIFPAAIPDQQTQELKRLSLLAHRTLGLRDFSRVDFRLDGDGSIFCLEVNTLPGMTVTSLLPQSAAVAGIEFAELCGRMVDRAVARRGSQVSS